MSDSLPPGFTAAGTPTSPETGLQPAPTATPVLPPTPSHAGVQQAMRGFSPAEMLRHRDDGAREMARMAGFANDPDVSRQQVADYIQELASENVLSPAEAMSILVSVPHSAQAIHAWAKMMFQSLMHASVHAHAGYPRELFPAAGSQQGEAPGGEEALP